MVDGTPASAFSNDCVLQAPTAFCSSGTISIALMRRAVIALCADRLGNSLTNQACRVFVNATVYLHTSIPWFGVHSGYECLTSYVPGDAECAIVSPTGHLRDRVLGKLISIRRRYGNAPQTAIAALWRFERELASSPRAIGHILYGEDFLRFLPRVAKEIMSRIVVTLHHPRGQWTDRQARLLGGISNAIVLWSRDVDFFTDRLGRTPTVILHGVDTTFFRPATDVPQRFRILYSGVYLRNISMLRSVIERLHSRIDGLHFDLLVPKYFRMLPDLQALDRLRNVTWHTGLSDEQLRSLYQASSLLLLPLRDSGANTAIVEALASGLPIVTTDVGGIRDYGGNAVFPLVADNDIDGMVKLVESYVDSANIRNQVGRACRCFAEKNLAWPLIAKRHMDFYGKTQAT